MIGIYKIENLINHNIYIGQSINIKFRFYQHKLYSTDLIKYKRNALGIDYALNYYGINNFSFDVIEECNIENLNQREIYWIQYFDSYNNGYNNSQGGLLRHYKKIDQYDKTGKFIQTFNSISEAADYASGTCNLINCLKGRNPSSGGYQWRYHGEEPPGPLIYKVVDAHNWSSAKKSIDQYTKDGQYITTFQSAHEAARSLEGKKNSGHISECCAGKRKSAYGFIWKYSNEDY